VAGAVSPDSGVSGLAECSCSSTCATSIAAASLAVLL
jgi:hypothetical protein